MATIKKLSSGRYQAQTYIKGVRKAKTFTRQIDPKRWATQLELDAESGLSEGARLPPFSLHSPTPRLNTEKAQALTSRERSFKLFTRRPYRRYSCM